MPTSTWLPDWSSVEPSSLSLLIGWEVGRTNVQIRRFPISQEVATQLQVPVRKTNAWLQAAVARPYTPDLELDDDEYAVVERTQLDPDSTLLTGLEKTTPFTGVSADLTKTLLFYAIAVGPMAQRLVFVRQLNPRRYLKDKMFTMFSEQLATVDKPLLSFDLDHVDIVLVSGAGLVVRSLKVYERLFRDSPELIARIGTKVDELNTALGLSDAAREILTTAARSNSRIRARLLAAIGRGHLKGLPVESLKAEMSRHGVDPDKHFEEGLLTLAPGEAMTIMQILNEDLAIGGLSHTRFVIKRKSPRS